MSISNAQFAAWLKDDNRQRTVLVEMDYESEVLLAPVKTTLYLSDRAYVDAAVPRAYIDAVSSVPQYSRSLSGDRLGVFSSSVGTLELDNADGRLDSLLDLSADGSEIRFYYGDFTWAKADFRLIFSALVVKIAAPAFDRISVQLSDTRLLVDKSVGGTVKVGGTGPNADRWRPQNFGYVHQVECVLVDAATLTYAYNNDYTGVYTSIASPVWTMAVRDKGNPVVYTDNADGTFTLAASPAGSVITADVLVAPGGSSGFRATSDAVSLFIGTLCGLTAAGKYTGPGPTYSTRPSTGIAAWISAGGEDYLVGLSVPEKRNAIDLLNQICDTGLCFWAITRSGMFTIGRLRPNYIAGLAFSTTHTISEDNIDDHAFRIERLDTKYYRIQATMSRNWTKITEVAGVLGPAEVAYLTRDGLYLNQAAGGTNAYADSPELYNLTLQPSPTVDTLISGGYDSVDLADFALYLEVRRAMSLPWISVISVTVGIEFYDVELGDVIPFDAAFSRFSLAGQSAQVISVNLRLTQAKVDLKLIRRNTQANYTSRSTTGATSFYLLQETSDKLLQETSDRIVL